MSLPWYGWYGLVFCAGAALLDAAALVLVAWDQPTVRRNTLPLWIAVWATAAVAIAVAGAR